MVYAVSYTVVLGCAFPYLSAPNGIIFSEVLGPRKQVVFSGTLLCAAFEEEDCLKR